MIFLTSIQYKPKIVFKYTQFLQKRHFLNKTRLFSKYYKHITYVYEYYLVASQWFCKSEATLIKLKLTNNALGLRNTKLHY